MMSGHTNKLAVLLSRQELLNVPHMDKALIPWWTSEMDDCPKAAESRTNLFFSLSELGLELLSV